MYTTIRSREREEYERHLNHMDQIAFDFLVIEYTYMQLPSNLCMI